MPVERPGATIFWVWTDSTLELSLLDIGVSLLFSGDWQPIDRIPEYFDGKLGVMSLGDAWRVAEDFGRHAAGNTGGGHPRDHRRPKIVETAIWDFGPLEDHPPGIV